MDLRVNLILSDVLLDTGLKVKALFKATGSHSQQQRRSCCVSNRHGTSPQPHRPAPVTGVLGPRVDNGGNTSPEKAMLEWEFRNTLGPKGQSEGGYTVLKKSAATLIAATLMLSACVPSGKIESLTDVTFIESEVESVSPEGESVKPDVESSGPRGFVFESGFLEFGDFDPYALGDNLFNPCTEIALEEYAVAGFPGIEVVDDGVTFYGRNACPIRGTEEQLNRLISSSFDNGRTNREMIEMQGLLLPQYTSELIPELFAFAANDHDPDFCYVQIDTLRGGIGASAGSFAPDVTQAELCELSIHIVEQLFLQFGTGDTR